MKRIVTPATAITGGRKMYSWERSRMLKGWMAPSPNIPYRVQNMTPSAYRHINLTARERIQEVNGKTQIKMYS